MAYKTHKKVRGNYFYTGGPTDTPTGGAAGGTGTGTNGGTVQPQGQQGNIDTTAAGQEAAEGTNKQSQGLGIISDIDNTVAGIFDVFNPHGMHSKLGDALKAVPGLGALGSIVNLFGGSTIDQNKINSIDRLDNQVANYNYNTSSTEGFLGDTANMLDLSHYSKHELGGHDSWFNSSARKKTNRLNGRITAAQELADKNYELAGNNLTQNNAFGVLSNYFADGGTWFNKASDWLDNNLGKESSNDANLANSLNQATRMTGILKNFSRQKAKPQVSLQSLTQGGNGIASFALGAVYNALDAAFGRDPKTESNAANQTVNYFDGGGDTWGDINKYAGMANDALSVINNAVKEGRLDFDPNNLFKKMNAVGSKYDNMRTGSTSDLLSQIGGQREMSYLDAGDFRANNKGGWGHEILDSFGNAINGFNAGAKTGNPFVAAGAAITGGISSLIGSAIGRNKAEHAAEKQHRIADYVNERMAGNNKNASENLQGNTLYRDLSQQYCRGGRLFEDGGATITADAINGNTNTTSNMEQQADAAPSTIGSQGMNGLASLTNLFGSPTGGALNFNNVLGIRKANGGTIHTDGSDFDTGSISIDAGGSHENNPNGGVQIGTDPQGNPNLVEEGEIVLNIDSDHPFVLSNRLKIPRHIRNKYKLRGDDTTYAQAYREILKEGDNRPNDPLSKKMRERVGQELAKTQEEQKALEKMQQIVQLMQAMQAAGIDPNQLASQQDGQQGVYMPQQQDQSYVSNGVQEGIQPQDPYSQEGINGINPNDMARRMAAYGGLLSTLGDANMFDDGGPTINWNKFLERLNNYKDSAKSGKGTKTSKYDPSDYYGVDSNFDLQGYGDIDAYESAPEYEAFTQYVLEHPDDENIKNYLKAIDANTGNTTNKYFKSDGTLRSDWKDVFSQRRSDHKTGINHLNPFGDEIALAKATDAINADFDHIPFVANPTELPWLVNDGTPYVDPRTQDPMQVIAAAKSTPKRKVTVTDNGTNLKAIPTDNGNNAQKHTGPEDKTVKPYPTWMRYVPAAGLGIASLTDALGLTNRPDYTHLDDAYQRLGNAMAEWGRNTVVHPYHIGDYLAPYQVDHLGTNSLIQGTAAANRIAQNVAGGNRAQALGATFANMLQLQQGLAKQRAAERGENHEYTVKQKAFNRNTNKFNANMDFEAERATQSNKGQFAAQMASVAPRMAALYQEEKARADAAKSKNLSLFLDSIGAIGKENLAWNQAGFNPYWRINYDNRRGVLSEVPEGWSGDEWRSLDTNEQADVRSGKKKKADFNFGCGGTFAKGRRF